MLRTIYFAGGCFWGTQKFFDSIKGVTYTEVGYANGLKTIINPSYEDVKTGETGFKETVLVEFDDKMVSVNFLIHAFFSIINPNLVNQQGHDIGTQYQSGIFYENDDEEAKIVSKALRARIAEKFNKCSVIVEPIKKFYKAEDYHQKYLDKNPNGYCHLNNKAFDRIKAAVFDPKPYEVLLTESFDENADTFDYLGFSEGPYKNKTFIFSKEKGLFVDALTSEPLFSSKDKVLTNYGYLTFSKPIDPNVVLEKIDNRFGINRIEILGRSSCAHIGYVNYDDEFSPTGVSYKVNTCAIRFIRVDDMKSEGYGEFIRFVD
jgi:peptide methionine sulfoxide reductase msrA/msrB